MHHHIDGVAVAVRVLECHRPISCHTECHAAHFQAFTITDSVIALGLGLFLHRQIQQINYAIASVNVPDSYPINACRISSVNIFVAIRLAFAEEGINAYGIRSGPIDVSVIDYINIVSITLRVLQAYGHLIHISAIV